MNDLSFTYKESGSQVNDSPVSVSGRLRTWPELCLVPLPMGFATTVIKASKKIGHFLFPSVCLQ